MPTDNAARRSRSRVPERNGPEYFLLACISLLRLASSVGFLSVKTQDSLASVAVASLSLVKCCESFFFPSFPFPWWSLSRASPVPSNYITRE